MAWAPDYVTASDFKEYRSITDTADDAQVALAVTSASRAVDSYCNRQFGVVATVEERTYLPWVNYVRGFIAVDIDDVMDTTGFAVAVDGVTVTDYTLEPSNAAAVGRPYTLLTLPDTVTTADEVKVTALWGWTSVPTPVEQATLLQASRFFKRRDSPHGIAGSPEMGTELRFLSALDADVQVALRGYRRRRAVL